MENKSEEVLRPGNQLLNDFDFELQMPSLYLFFRGLLPVSVLLLTPGAAF